MKISVGQFSLFFFGEPLNSVFTKDLKNLLSSPFFFSIYGDLGRVLKFYFKKSKPVLKVSVLLNLRTVSYVRLFSQTDYEILK